MPDMELIERTMAHIVDHPEQHNQGTVWLDYGSCGTPGCFIGWAMYFDGYQSYDDYCERSGDFSTSAEWAAYRLGLSERDANVIFYSRNSIETLQLMVKDIANTGHVRPGGVTAYPQHQKMVEEQINLARVVGACD